MVIIKKFAAADIISSAVFIRNELRINTEGRLDWLMMLWPLLLLLSQTLAKGHRLNTK